jgi:hypothetical protein
MSVRNPFVYQATHTSVSTIYYRKSMVLQLMSVCLANIIEGLISSAKHQMLVCGLLPQFSYLRVPLSDACCRHLFLSITYHFCHYAIQLRYIPTIFMVCGLVSGTRKKRMVSDSNSWLQTLCSGRFRCGQPQSIKLHLKFNGLAFSPSSLR